MRRAAAPAWTIVLACCLGAAACAHGPALTLTSAGSAPEPGSAFRFASEGVGEHAADAVIRPQVETRLAARGFQRTGAAARYVVEVAVTSRPSNVGAMAGASGAEPRWLTAPASRRRGRADRLCQVRVRFIDAMSGREAYRVEALQPSRAPDCDAEDIRLVDAALTDIPLPSKR